MPIGGAFRRWHDRSRKVYMELLVSELEGHGTTWNGMPKDIKIQREVRQQKSQRMISH